MKLSKLTTVLRKHIIQRMWTLLFHSVPHINGIILYVNLHYSL